MSDKLNNNSALSTQHSALAKGIESQNIEWKQSWQDDYLKWICGFANAQGGRIVAFVPRRGAQLIWRRVQYV